MSLRETQELFWRAITHPTGVRDFLQSADDDTRRLFERTFAETPEFSRADRVDVYANGYFWRLHDVLADQFEVARYVLGPEHFQNLATDYVLGRPSRDPDLRQFGSGLPEFVRSHELAREFPCLGHVCDVEWALSDVLDAADADPLSRDALAEEAAERLSELRFSLRSTTRLFWSEYDFSSLWRAMKKGVGTRDPGRGPRRAVLVYRRGLSVHHRSLGAGEGAALAALATGATFEEFCAAGMAAEPGIPPSTAAAWIGTWLEDGLLGQVFRGRAGVD